MGRRLNIVAFPGVEGSGNGTPPGVVRAEGDHPAL
jgi:hypothetical protein